jgi:hypothetical protein
MNLLDGFEGTLVQLESTILPLQSQTKNLSIAQKHIDSTISETAKVFAHTEVANEPENVTTERDIAQDWRGFLSWVDLVQDSATFFQQHSQFVSSKDCLAKLRKHSQYAGDKIKAEFKRLIDFHLKPVDEKKIVKPIPAKLELLHPGMLDRLSKMAGAMESLGELKFLKIIAEGLRRALSDSVKNLEKQHKSNEKKEKKKTGEEKTEKKVGRYKAGSHRVIFHIEFMLKLLQSQAELISLLTTYCKDIQLGAFDEVLYAVLLEFVSQCMLALDAKQGPDRLLLALDVLDKLQNIRSDFRFILRNSNHLLEPLLDFRRQLTTMGQTAIVSYCEYISRFEMPRGASRNGTVYSLNVETLSFLKKLREYEPVLNSIERNSLLPPNFVVGADPSNLGPMLRGFMAVLDENMLKTSASFKHRQLASVFMLNNVHHACKQLSGPELDVDGQWLATYEARVERARKEYMTASWSEIAEVLEWSSVDALIVEVKQAGSGALQSKTRTKIKEKLKKFNELFEKAIRMQKDFACPDAALRTQLRNDNTQLIVPLYRHAYTGFVNAAFTSSSAKYLPVTPEKMEESMSMHCFLN